MEPPGTTLIQEIYGAFGRGDLKAVSSLVRPDALWDFNVAESDVPWHVPVTGPAEVERFLVAFVENIDLHAFEPLRFLEVENEVLVHLHLSYTVKRTGKQVDEEQIQWWTVNNGKVARLRHFEDTAQVVAAWAD